MAGLQVEEDVERGFAGIRGLARPGLIGRAVAIDDEVARGARNLKIAEKNARAPKSSAR